MVAIYCALLFAGIVLPNTAPDATQAPVCELYRQASAALTADDVDGAFVALDTLITSFPKSPLSEVAVVHLAELHLLRQQPRVALELLANWAPRVESSTTLDRLAPSTRSQFLDVFARGLVELPQTQVVLEPLARLHTRLTPDPAETAETLRSKLRLEVAVTLARTQEKLRNYQAAEDWLQRACEESTEPRQLKLKDDLAYRLPLLQVQNCLAQNDADGALDRLQQFQLADLPSERQVAVRFLILEAAQRGHNTSLLEEQLAWLERFIDAQERVPAWAPTLALRSAEHLCRHKRYHAASQVLLQAMDDYPEFPQRNEYALLQARCAIAVVDFESASAVLHTVLQSPHAEGHEALPKAEWLLGEIRFMQHDYATAITYYQRAAERVDFPDWQVRARLQMAKCQESLGQPQAALDNYRKAVESQISPQNAQEALGRIATLSEALGAPVR
ncbi:tetratricopeptide repeat protein [Aureliella helgolandensis]|uniref:Outer membrane protein assembly factor BamD n=1 Tax=Aureliella helgolandensis TaxID=2527968 RepID=A0A518G240_9BACT|nr:tetratricopeptide repeat protein [Aureliella helgolandensis]QDV22661.1 Outer membrane protein assembly factor BamD [Aureliella helgolandensis]